MATKKRDRPAPSKQVNFRCPVELWEFAAQQPVGCARFLVSLLEAARARAVPVPAGAPVYRAESKP